MTPTLNRCILYVTVKSTTRERGDNVERSMIADNLRYLRKKKGVTQTEVAKALGVPVSTYNAYETGQNVPKDPMKQRIANYYSRSVQFIFFRDITH